MDNDLISRQAAIDALGERPHLWTDCDYELGCANQYDLDRLAIETVPSAERKGQWIRTGEDGYCSICKCDMPMFRNDWEWEYTETPYCPNCGARMEETE